MSKFARLGITLMAVNIVAVNIAMFGIACSPYGSPGTRQVFFFCAGLLCGSSLCKLICYWGIDKEGD